VKQRSLAQRACEPFMRTRMKRDVVGVLRQDADAIEQQNAAVM
jgi:hypothetical protein